MTNTVNLGKPLLFESTQNGHVTANALLDALDAFTALRIISTTNTPPGSPTSGAAHICGASPTGAWAGWAGYIAIYRSGWKFYLPVPGMRIRDLTTDEIQEYHATYGWFPVQPRDSGTEHWTGRFSGGTGATNRVYAKVLSGTSLPNNTSKNIAHGITNLDSDEAWIVWAMGEKTASSFQLPAKSATELCGLTIDGTNVVAVSNFDASSWDLRCRIEYRKTA